MFEIHYRSHDGEWGITAAPTAVEADERMNEILALHAVEILDVTRKIRWVATPNSLVILTY